MEPTGENINSKEFQKELLCNQVNQSYEQYSRLTREKTNETTGEYEENIEELYNLFIEENGQPKFEGILDYKAYWNNFLQFIAKVKDKASYDMGFRLHIDSTLLNAEIDQNSQTVLKDFLISISPYTTINDKRVKSKIGSTVNEISSSAEVITGIQKVLFRSFVDMSFANGINFIIRNDPTIAQSCENGQIDPKWLGNKYILGPGYLFNAFPKEMTEGLSGALNEWYSGNTDSNLNTNLYFIEALEKLMKELLKKEKIRNNYSDKNMRIKASLFATDEVSRMLGVDVRQYILDAWQVFKNKIRTENI